MNHLLIIKILAIGVTLFHFNRNHDQIIKIIGYLFIGIYLATFIENQIVTGLALTAYVLVNLSALILITLNRIKTEKRNLLTIFFAGTLLIGLSMILSLPLLIWHFFLALVTVSIYVYYLFIDHSSNILVITTIPVVNSVYRFTDLISSFF